MVNELIRESLSPYPADLAVVSKLGGPFSPLVSNKEQQAAIFTNPAVTQIAAGHGATPSQVVLAWLLGISDNLLLIPGTGSLAHLADNLGAGSVSLSRGEIDFLTTTLTFRRP
jgi:aryl-alcohol dehydrogenase-like predicted oxidoreductase